MSIGSNVEKNIEEETVHQMPREVDVDGMDQDPAFSTGTRGILQQECLIFLDILCKG